MATVSKVVGVRTLVLELWSDSNWNLTIMLLVSLIIDLLIWFGVHHRASRHGLMELGLIIFKHLPFLFHSPLLAIHAIILVKWHLTWHSLHHVWILILFSHSLNHY